MSWEPLISLGIVCTALVVLVALAVDVWRHTDEGDR